MNPKTAIVTVVIGVAVAVGAWAWWQDRRAPLPAPAAPSNATAPLPAGATALPTNVVISNRIVVAELAREWPRWLTRPTRDPFQILQPARSRQSAPATPVSRFKLMALWLQTGGRLAVIDQRVYGEGDQLAEYRILRIDPEGVVVRGADGEDRITFTSYVPAPKVPAGRGTNLIEQWLGPEKEDLF